MFSKILLLTLASSVFAAVPPMQLTHTSGSSKAATEPISQCSTGHAQCCESTQKATDAEPAKLLGKLGVAVPGADVLVGVTCSPIPVVDPTCAHQPVCCENNNFNGVINIGCTPISL